MNLKSPYLSLVGRSSEGQVNLSVPGQEQTPPQQRSLSVSLPGPTNTVAQSGRVSPMGPPQHQQLATRQTSQVSALAEDVAITIDEKQPLIQKEKGITLETARGRYVLKYTIINATRLMEPSKLNFNINMNPFEIGNLEIYNWKSEIYTHNLELRIRDQVFLKL